MKTNFTIIKIFINIIFQLKYIVDNFGYKGYENSQKIYKSTVKYISFYNQIYKQFNVSILARENATFAAKRVLNIARISKESDTNDAHNEN